MAYELQEVLRISRLYHELESEATNFLSLFAFAMKHKELKIKSAKKLLKIISDYKKLPSEVRNALEEDKSKAISKIYEVESLCLQTIKE